MLPIPFKAPSSNPFINLLGANRFKRTIPLIPSSPVFNPNNVKPTLPNAPNTSEVVAKPSIPTAAPAPIAPKLPTPAEQGVVGPGQYLEGEGTTRFPKPLAPAFPTPPIEAPKITEAPVVPTAPDTTGATAYTGQQTLAQKLADIQKQINEKQRASTMGDIGLEAGQAKLGDESSERGIALPILRGQQEKLAQQRAIQQRAESADLSYLSNEEANILNQLAIDRDLTKPTQVGNKLVQFNPETNKYSVVFEDIDEEMNKPVVVGKGSALVDPITGRVIYEGETSEASELNELLTPTEAATLNVPYGTTKLEAMKLGVTPKSVLTGVEKIKTEIAMAKDFQRNIGEAKKALRNITIIETGYNEAIKAGLDGRSLNAPSQAVLVTFQKMLDPTSVVRESEYARSGDGQSFMQRIEGTIQKLRYGGAGVTQVELEQFYNVSKELLKGYKMEMNDEASRIKTAAGNYGLELENILSPDVLSLIGESGAQDLTSFYQGQTPKIQEQINQIIRDNPNISDEDILDLFSFNQVGGDTNSAIKINSNLGKKNNNPGNLRFVGQAGATQGEGGFARFETPEAGYKALKSQIMLDSSRGLSLRQFITKYAPPNENDTELYIKQMMKQTGASENTPIKNINLNVLAQAMAFKESGTIIA